MDPAMLLNPKAYAKQKKQAAAGKKKPAPNYGPKQSRKPPATPPRLPDNKMSNQAPAAVSGTGQGQATSSPNKPVFDARTLLDPKGASKRPDSQAAAAMQFIGRDSEMTEDTPSGMGSMIENMNGLTARSDAPNRKRKADAVDDDDDKKRKTTFTGASQSGLLGEEIKKQKKKNANVVDLTEDDDRAIALDDEAIAHNRANQGSSRVILGMLELQINAHKVPSVSATSDGKFKEPFWKPTQVTLSQDKQTHGGKIIHVIDRRKERFGKLLLPHVRALLPLLQGQHIIQFNYKAFLPARPRTPTEAVGRDCSERLTLHLLFDAPRKSANNIGKRLKEQGLEFIDPRYNLGDMEYVNPQWPSNHHIVRKVGLPSGPSAAAAAEARHNQRSAEEMQHDVNTIFEHLDQYETLEEMAAPKMIIGDLYTHQKQALFYMTKHEQPDEVFERDDGLSDFSLWQKKVGKNRSDVYYHTITSQEVPIKPDATRGGLLADQMGMGKTLSCISLICSSLDDAAAFARQKSSTKLSTECTTKATLVVCPVSLIEVWKGQIKRYTGNKLKVLDYRGTNRNRAPSGMRDYDVVITSYNLVSQEWRSQDTVSRNDVENTLGSVDWFRVVLDEAHEIRNPVTGLAKSCCALSAERRWAVTGTPTQNKLEDLGTLIRFLRVQPFDQQKTWTTYIDSQLKAGEEKAYQNLQLLVQSITLRRTKDKMDQRLPEYMEEIVKLEFSEPERELYNKILDQGSNKLRPLFDSSDAPLKGKQYMSIFTIINQLRMACAHGREMMSEKFMEELEAGNSNVDVFELGDDEEADQQGINEKAAYEHFFNMVDNEENECTNCGELIEEPEDDDDSEESKVGYVTNCADMVCPKCVGLYDAHIAADNSLDGYAQCPLCKTYGPRGKVALTAPGFERTRRERQRAEEWKQGKIKWTPETYSGPHTKVKQLISDLKTSISESAALAKGEPPIRSVVFSGWTQMLDLVAYALKLEGMPSARIDGTMASTKRGEEIHKFNTNPAIRVFLVSIKAGGQGINLEAANKVYMLEPQYNPGVEQQAFQRVHRIGQKRAVVVKRFVMEDSVEEGVVRLQRKKEQIAKKSLERRGKGKEKEDKGADLKLIFQ